MVQSRNFPVTLPITNRAKRHGKNGKANVPYGKRYGANSMNFTLRPWRISINPYCITSRFRYLSNKGRIFQRSGSLAEKIRQGQMDNSVQKTGILPVEGNFNQMCRSRRRFSCPRMPWYTKYQLSDGRVGPSGNNCCPSFTPFWSCWYRNGESSM